MSRIIAISNVKGGVGKTTATGNLAAALAGRGRKVLTVDLDPQASLTLSFGFKVADFPKTIGDALGSTAAPVASLLVRTGEDFDLVPANHSLRQTEHELENRRIRIFAVRDALEPLRAQYDYMLLDCPANAGILTSNALAAADEVIIPFPADYLALEALGWFLEIIRDLQSKVTPQLRVAGLFLAMYDPRLPYARDIIAAAQKCCGMEIPFFSAAVHQDVAIRQASQVGQSILRFAPDSQAAQSYRQLAQEVEEGVREAPAEDAYAAIRKGRAALAEHELARAHGYFCLATKLNPQLVDGWIGRAQSSLEWDDAMRNFAHALVLDWARAEARNGIEFHLNGHLPRLDAEDIPRLMAVGHFLAKFSFPAYAEKVYFRVTDLDESHLEAWLGRARAASTPQEAVKCFERALQLNPEDAQTRLELQAAEERLRTDAIGLVEDAQALTRKGAREQARALLEQVTQMDPKNERAWVGLARTTDDLDTALEFVKRALEIDPQNAEALELHSWLWRPKNEPREPGRARRLLLSIGLAALVILVALALLGLAFMR